MYLLKIKSFLVFSGIGFFFKFISILWKYPVWLKKDFKSGRSKIFIVNNNIVKVHQIGYPNVTSTMLTEELKVAEDLFI